MKYRPSRTVNQAPTSDHALAAARAAAERHPPVRRETARDATSQEEERRALQPHQRRRRRHGGRAGPVSDAVRAGVAAAATAAYAYAGVVRCGEVASAGSSSRWCRVHARISSGLGGDREGGGRTAKGA